VRTLSFTDAPAVMGISISKTMILAVNNVANGTKSVGGQSTLPMPRVTGFMAVRLRVTFDPDAAQGTNVSSSSIAAQGFMSESQ
jgi:hypothetical protein